MIAIRCVVDGVPRSCAEFEERLALGVEQRSFGRCAPVHREPFIPVAGVPGYRMDGALLTWSKIYYSDTISILIYWYR